MEAIGFSGFGRRMLEETLEALKDSEPKTAGSGPAAGPQTIDELERQAADLEKKAKELRDEIEALKKTRHRPAATKSVAPAASN